MGLINIAVSSCSAAQAKIIFAASKVKTSGKNGAKAKWKVEMGRSADLLPLWGLEGGEQQLHQGRRCFSLLSLEITFPVFPLFLWSDSLYAWPGLHKVSRRTGAISLLQAVDHPLCLSPQLAFIYKKKLLLLVGLTSVVSQLQEET